MIAEGVAGKRQGEPGKGLSDNIITWGGYLKNNDTFLSASDGTWIGYNYSKEDLTKNFNLLRTGLPEVPYDNYPALLHEGEAVLTASTANEMRNLLDEYRQTKQDSINFDVIIQNQTTALINKMDQIIQTITTNDAVNTTKNKTNTSENTVKTNMRKMIGTKAFN